jgi:hypothetical protein
VVGAQTKGCVCAPVVFGIADGVPPCSLVAKNVWGKGELVLLWWSVDE